VDARSFNVPVTRINHTPREELFKRYIDGTLEAYGNTKDNTWFVEAVRHRIVDSSFIVEATVGDCCTGYIGVDNMRILGAGVFAFVGIATIFPYWKKMGIMQYLLGSLDGYDGVMIRTQNPQICTAFFATFQHAIPLTEKPSIIARHCARTLADMSNSKFDEDTFVCKGIYDGRRLTGQSQTGRPWAEKALEDRGMHPENGDAIILVSLFDHHKRVQQ